MTVLAVTFGDLVTVAVAASVAGIGVTAIFSLAILGATRRAERRREGASAAGWTVLAVVAGAGVLLASAVGIYAVAS